MNLLQKVLRARISFLVALVFVFLLGGVGGFAVAGRFQLVEVRWGTWKVDSWTGRAWSLERTAAACSALEVMD